jgi:ATP-dependent Clp protease adapter protein ClpS
VISREVEVALHRAFVNAREQRHQYISVEHLLLAMLDAPTAVRILKGCGADLDALAERLAQHIAKATPGVPEGEEVDTQPTLGFQRVIQRAILKVQSSAKKEVTGEDVLVAIFGEKDSHAVRLLGLQKVGRLEVVEFISHSADARASQPAQEGSDVQVVIYNDDFTPMAFVVAVLEQFFEMSAEDAKETMLEVHREGVAVCGLYSRQEGDQLVAQVAAHARAHGHPLRCAALTPR